MNHSPVSDSKVNTKVIIIPDDVKLTNNEFSCESDKSNEEHQILCEDKWLI